jgi:predicted DNA-binding transcriptional regulator YafY
MRKNERLSQIEYMLLHHSGGLRRAEIARRLGVHRSTVSRDIDELTSYRPIIEDDDGVLRIDKRGYLTSVSLTMFELEALHLSARLFSRVMKFPFPHAAAALRKLAEAQSRVSDALAARIKDSADEIELSASGFTESQIRYREIIEKLGLAISEMRPITACHYSSRKMEEQSFSLLPVTLEPHPEGKAVHLAGWEYLSDFPFFRTLKIERISKVELEKPAPELFTSIPIEQLKARFAAAWSIWTSDEEPQKVVLRFSSSVASRVDETQWHQSQEIRNEPGGSILWIGRIAEPREMYPWIRGWGPDVEVLEPVWLRELHREDFLCGADMYRKKEN